MRKAVKPLDMFCAWFPVTLGERSESNQGSRTISWPLYADIYYELICKASVDNHAIYIQIYNI